jgi:hypothetical protein
MHEPPRRPPLHLDWALQRSVLNILRNYGALDPGRADISYSGKALRMHGVAVALPGKAKIPGTRDRPRARPIAAVQ